jgi:hypothetical protein
LSKLCSTVQHVATYCNTQVMVTPTGQPGVNPSQDVSVPINWAYNHHYSATLPQPRPLSAVTCLDHALLLLLTVAIPSHFEYART